MPHVARAQSATVRMLHIERPTGRCWNLAAARVASFEAANPGVKVEMRSLETEALQTRLPTILQSDSRPTSSIPGRRAGGHAGAAGFLENIAGQIEPAYRAGMMPAAMAQFQRGDQVYGLPYNTAEIGILYNRPRAVRPRRRQP